MLPYAVFSENVQEDAVTFDAPFTCSAPPYACKVLVAVFCENVDAVKVNVDESVHLMAPP